MNFDLITKLAKLANNNSNDNEANSAARKVCRLLAEAEYKFIADTVQPVQNQQQRQQKDWRWEPSEKQKKYYEDLMSDLWGRKEDWFKDRGARTNSKQSQEDNRSYTHIEYDWAEEKPKKKPEERELACSKCGDVIKTYFVGHSTQFMCYQCQFNEHNQRT